MNEYLKDQLNALIENPAGFHGTSGEQHKMVERMKRNLEEDRIDVNDLMDICLGFDFNPKTTLMRAFTPYRVFFEDTITDCIEKDDLRSLLLITSMGIIHHNGSFYTVMANYLRDHNRISEEIMNQLREYLLKKGYPLNARTVSTPDSFCQLSHLSEAVCTEDTLMKYVFLAGGIDYPFIDSISIAFFNQLADEDKEYLLDQLLNSYRKFRYERVDSTAITVEDDSINMIRIIPKADFEALETDSPKKDALIALQEEYFG